jgi:transglutaminase-like putative cysteine protease
MDSIADQILADLGVPGLSTEQKLVKIYNYVRSNLAFVHDTQNLDVYISAYNALKTRRGDCYAHYALSELLIRRSGIQTMKVQRINSRTDHYWNLVNVDGSWYHFDATPFEQKADQHMFTEKRAQQLTTLRHNHCYEYDTSLYPEVVWE